MIHNGILDIMICIIVIPLSITYFLEVRKYLIPNFTDILMGGK